MLGAATRQWQCEALTERLALCLLADDALPAALLLHFQHSEASGKYDIITANIVANAIMSLAPAVPGLMADDAVFIASGIIDSRKDEVIAGLEAAGLAVQEVKEKHGWECIVCRRK